MLINYFHVIILLSLYILWKETLPFIRNYDLEDKIKMFAKLTLIIAIMVLTLDTFSISNLVELDQDITKAELYIFGTSLRFDIDEDNKEELSDLRDLLNNVRVKFSLKFPKERYIGYTVKMYLDTKEGFLPFQVTDSNHIWYQGKFYKVTNIDLFAYLEEALKNKDIGELPDN